MTLSSKPFQVKTKRQSDVAKTARMPHERDESDDSQEAGSGDRHDIKQAYEDIQNGLVDTDLRGSRGSTNVAGGPEKLPSDISGQPPDKPSAKPPRGK